MSHFSSALSTFGMSVIRAVPADATVCPASYIPIPSWIGMAELAVVDLPKDVKTNRNLITFL